MIDRDIFRAYDIRGVYGETLTPEVMKLIGVALRKKFPGESFIVGNDVRASSETLASALIAGLQSGAGEAVYAGTTAFGETLSAGLMLKKDKTLYITASHLPPEWNGVKMFFGDGEAFSSELIQEIRDIILKELAPQLSFNEEYLSFLAKTFKITLPLKVVVDCGNGSTCLTAPKAFERLGFSTVLLHDKIDPSFPARTADIKPAMLTVLREKVLAEKADFGVAFDGDGDRSIFVDECGNFHRSDRIGLILAKQLLPRSKRKTVIATVSVSMAAETQLKPLGAKVLRVPVGHTFVANSCKKHNALIGMEESGHLFLTDYFFFDDALIVPLKIAEIMCQSGKKLSELAGGIPDYPFDEISFTCSDDRKFKLIADLAGKLSAEYKDVSTLDGLRVSFEDGWILIRASNTEPKVRLYVEATTQERFDSLKQKFINVINEALATHG